MILKCVNVDYTAADFRRISHALQPPGFEEAQLREVRANGVRFSVLWVERRKERGPKVYVETDYSFVVRPRYTAYRDHWIIIPRENLAGPRRRKMRDHDLLDLVRWSRHQKFIATVSTYLGGASHPLYHGQTLPLARSSDNTPLTSLIDPAVRMRMIVKRGTLPRYTTAEIALVENYPVRGIRLRGDEAEVVEITYGLAAGWRSLTAYNVIIVPRDAASPDVFFFPRRRDGRTAVGPDMHQVAALEINGLIQTKRASERDAFDEPAITRMFAETSPSYAEFVRFLTLLDVPGIGIRPDNDEADIEFYG